MIPDLQQLKEYVQQIQPLSEIEWDAFAEIWKPFNANRKVKITTMGQQERFLYFVSAGAQRVYYRDDEDREATLVFTYPFSFGGVLDAMLLEKPSKYFYETLTESRFLRAPYIKLKALQHTHCGIQSLIDKALHNSIAGLLAREVELQCFSSEDKFRSLLKRSPHIIHLIPHKYLANYLGIYPTNFSKFMNQIIV